jgi:hypothetical protein
VPGVRPRVIQLWTVNAKGRKREVRLGSHPENTEDTESEAEVYAANDGTSLFGLLDSSVLPL